MKRLLLIILFVLAIPAIAYDLPRSFRANNHKKLSSSLPVFMSSPESVSLPQELVRVYQGMRMPGAEVDTFLLGEWDFNDGTQGWSSEDRTAQLDTFFHITDFSTSAGGNFGNLLPLEGNQSLWCGKEMVSESPFCDWATLPGYGHNWDQRFESQVFTGDTITISYKIRWDVEPGYDFGYCQYFDSTWIDLPVNDGSYQYDNYLGSGYGNKIESFAVVPESGSTRFRFRFMSDDWWDGEDGRWPTDGALIIDSLIVTEITRSQSWEPMIVGSPEGWSGFGRRIAISGNHAFVTTGAGTVQSIDISDPENPVLRGSYATPGAAYDIAIAGDYAYVADGTTIQVLDISDPDNPSYQGSSNLFMGIATNGRGVAVAGNLAYVTHSLGIEWFNISNPAFPSFAGIEYGVTDARDLTIHGNYAYIVGGPSGLNVLDITNPASPTLMGGLPLWVGTAYSVAISGNYAYLASGTNGTAVVDISDPWSPALVAAHSTAGEATFIDIQGDSAYVADGSGGLCIVDITNPLSTVAADTLAMPSDAMSLAFSGEYIYVVTNNEGPQSVRFIEDTMETVYFEDFEDEAEGKLGTDDGVWGASVAPPFGNFASLTAGSGVMQEDPCRENNSYLWGFFDAPGYTNYSCGGYPGQGAIPYGPDETGYCLNNIIISPPFPLTDTGSSVKLRFSVYRDLPLDNLQFYYWQVRSSDGACMGRWESSDFLYYGDSKDWFQASLEIGNHIEPDAVTIQVAVGVVDMYPYWSGLYGTGSCHSHAPLIDDISVIRIDYNGPVFSVRYIDLFQDNFSADGTTTGTARADMAQDLLGPDNTAIQPGDSMVITVSDAEFGLGTLDFDRAAVRAYVRRHGYEGACGEISALETRFGTDRYPLIETNGDYCVFAMDTAFTDNSFTTPVPGRFCFDLNDDVLVPGDSISYFFGAMNTTYEWTYCYRTMSGQGSIVTTDDLSEAMMSPFEFCVLPRAGRDILYVDDSDDRGGPVQAYFDAAFEEIGVAGRVDRFDILGPSSCVGNSLASRVISSIQLGGYDAIIWSSGNLRTGLIGDGTDSPEKSGDYQMLHDYMDLHHPTSDRFGIYLSGDNVAEEWYVSPGSGSGSLKSTYMDFVLENGDHRAVGEPESPRLMAYGDVFDSTLAPDSIVAYGGCFDINDFDVLVETGSSIAEMINPNTGIKYILSQQTTSGAGEQAGAILSGFSFHELRDDYEQYSGLQQARHLQYILEYLLGEDLGNIDQPVYPCHDLIGTCPTSSPAWDVAVSGDYAFVVSTAGFYSIDITDPANPDSAGFCATLDEASAIIVRADYAYVADCWQGMTVIDISDPTSPFVAGNCNPQGPYLSLTPSGLDIEGNYLYMACSSLANLRGLVIVDVSDPTDPDSVGFCETDNARQVVVSGDFAYIADMFSFKVIDVSDPSDPFIVASRPSSVTDYYSVSLLDDYAYIGGYDLTIFDISDPENPDSVNFCETPFIREIVFSGQYAYGVGGYNLTVLDASVSDAPEVYMICGGQTEIISGIFVSGEYTYTAYGNEGLNIFDLHPSETTGTGDQAPRNANFLKQNYPNPFNPTTTIQYGVEKKGPVSLRIYDVSGRLVRTLVNSIVEAGQYRVVWDGRGENGRNIASGIYFARIETPGFVQSRKLVLLR